MPMQRLLAVAALAVGVCFASPALADHSAITTSGDGHDLTVVVHGITDYCSTNAKTDIVRRGDSIRIVRDRPTSVSRCMTTRDLTFVLHDVTPGTYTISYEQIPLLAPARFLKLASATVAVAPPAPAQ